MLAFKDINNYLHIVNISKISNAVFYQIEKSNDMRVSIHFDKAQVLAAVINYETCEFIRKELVKWEQTHA